MGYMSPYTQENEAMEIHDQGQKRNLSFNSNTSPNMTENELNSLRHHSLTLCLNQPTFGLLHIPDCYSNVDLLAEITDVVPPQRNGGGARLKVFIQDKVPAPVNVPQPAAMITYNTLL